MKKSSLIFLVSTFLFLILVSPALATTYYVDNYSGLDTNNGSQSSPFKTINHAMTPGDVTEIHVKQETYSLSPGPGTITITPGVYLRGGYKPDWSTQEADPSKTIIDGGSYGGVQCMSGTNLTAATTIENFTIQNGRNVSGNGGGLYLINSSPAITNSIFNSNTTVNYGGGICNDSSSPEITSCTFTSNSASDSGGGIYNLHSSSPTITNCTFTSNGAGLNAGAIENDHSSAIITNCTFNSNQGYNGGGGVLNMSSSTTITNCTFTSNNGHTNCSGGIWDYSSNSTIKNCIFTSNKGGIGGGGICFQNTCSTVENCTFTSNEASNGSGIYTYSAQATVTNSIIYGNTGTNIYNFDTPSPIVNYCCVQGGYPTGTGNISAEPHFVNASAGDVHLQAVSPCIDAGTGLASTEGLGYQQGYGTNQDGIHGDSDRIDMGYHYFGYSQSSILSTYTTKVGNAGSWQ
jgi:parallel beta-helix repeat protein